MKAIGNLLIGILGIGMIFFVIYNLLGFSGKDYDNGTMFGGIIFGLLLIWISFKKDKKTTAENYVEKENITILLWWKRLIGFVVDFVIILIIYSLFVSISAEIYNTRINKIYNPLLLISPFIVFYYSLQEYLFNTSIGKMIFKLKVVSAKANGKPTFSQIIIRSLSRLIPIDIFFYLFKRPIGLHDIISKTVVIKKILYEKENNNCFNKYHFVLRPDFYCCTDSN